MCVWQLLQETSINSRCVKLRPIHTGVVIASHDAFAQRLATSKCQHDATERRVFLLAMHTKRDTSVAIENAKTSFSVGARLR